MNDDEPLKRPPQVSRLLPLLSNKMGWVLIVGAVVGAVSLFVGASSQENTITGTVTVACSTSDITSGTQVKVKDEFDHVLGTSKLGAEVADDADHCQLPFTVSGLGKARFYAIGIGRSDEPVMVLSHRDLVRAGWTVSLGLKASFDTGEGREPKTPVSWDVDPLTCSEWLEYPPQQQAAFVRLLLSEGATPHEVATATQDLIQACNAQSSGGQAQTLQSLFPALCRSESIRYTCR